jgi:hypothetical protein
MLLLQVLVIVMISVRAANCDIFLIIMKEIDDCLVINRVF